MTAIETLISLVIGSLVAFVVFQQFGSLFSGIKANTDAAGMAVDARQALDTMADHFRNATPCTTCSTNTNSVFQTANATTFTYYTSNDGSAWVQYKYYSTTQGVYKAQTLYRVQNDGVVKAVASNITTFSLTYYKTSFYNASVLNTPWTAISGVPNTSDYPSICGVRFDLTVTWNGKPTRIQTMVRLRNSPKKVGADGTS
ncbi:hypothetical protein EON79_11390 [bacterium]|nr:MAG: hypothetical protein EON79_11390 [bacterium]